MIHQTRRLGGSIRFDRTTRRLAAASLVLATAAQAADPHWFATPGANGTLARWGIPETDAVGFEVACRSGAVTMRPALFAMEEPAAVPDIVFDVDGTRYVRKATLAFSERDGAWQALADVEKDDDLIDALRRGSTVSYDFDPPLREGDRFTVSLEGSANAIDDALDGC